MGRYPSPMRGQTLPVRAAMVSLYVAVGAFYRFIPVYYNHWGIGLDGIGLLGALAAAAGAVAAPLWGQLPTISGRHVPSCRWPPQAPPYPLPCCRWSLRSCHWW